MGATTGAGDHPIPKCQSEQSISTWRAEQMPLHNTNLLMFLSRGSGGAAAQLAQWHISHISCALRSVQLARCADRSRTVPSVLLRKKLSNIPATRDNATLNLWHASEDPVQLVACDVLCGSKSCVRTTMQSVLSAMGKHHALTN